MCAKLPNMKKHNQICNLEDNTMLNIAICDDTPEERELVCALARRYFEEKNCPVRFSVYDSMQSVLDFKSHSLQGAMIFILGANALIANSKRTWSLPLPVAP